jgi:hypothetical protein
MELTTDHKQLTRQRDKQANLPGRRESENPVHPCRGHRLTIEWTTQLEGSRWRPEQPASHGPRGQHNHPTRPGAPFHHTAQRGGPPTHPNLGVAAAPAAQRPGSDSVRSAHI